MQVKQELSNNLLDDPLQDMQCADSKTSPYSLWADYFDSFPSLAEFDLRTGVGSTNSSIASTSSASSESWPSPGSDSPFSDCSQEESPFIDDHSVPTSVIDEIVQTLKMDGYNFDHLTSDDVIDTTNLQSIVKQEQDILASQPCYISSQPIYTSLNPPKLQQYDTRKYNQNNNNNNNNNVTSVNAYDSTDQKTWYNMTLPPMGMTIQHLHNASHPQPLVHSQQHSQQHTSSPSYAVQEIAGGMFSMFNTNFPIPSAPVLQQCKFLTSSEPLSPQSSAEKLSESKPRRRRSNAGNERLEKPHVCKECGAAFKLSANLKQHQVIHTGEKPFSCEICKAMFTRLSSLKTHHRLHTGEKPHICPFCSAAFADRSAMKAHKRIHTGERPYKCAVCSTSFTQLSHLNAHKRTHTGEKPYACQICGTTFKQLGHLKRHEKSHVCSRI